MTDEVSSLILGQPKSQFSVEDVKKMIHGQESNFGKIDTSKPNYAGAYGEMQITKPTFDTLKNKGLIPVSYNINNPSHSKNAADVLIEDAYKRHQGDVDKVLAEYYAGPGAINGDKIHTEWRDKKNPKAPSVGEYIDQAKSKVAPVDDISALITGKSLSTTNPQEKESKKLFTDDFKEALKDISWEGFKKESLGYNLSVGMNPLSDVLYGKGSQTQAIKNLYEQGKGLVSGVGQIIQNPKEVIQNVIEHPGTTLGQMVKGVVYDPELLLLPAGKVKPSVKVAEQTVKPRYTIKDGKIVPKEIGEEAKIVSPEEIKSGTAKQATPDDNFSEPYYGEKELSLEEQKARKETLERIDPNLKVHENVIKGLGKDRATQYQVAKTDTELGNLYKQQFNEEKATLNKFGENLVKDTGGTFGLDESAKYKSGNIILDPLKKLENYFNEKTSQLYKLRDIEAKGVPVTSENVLKVLRDESINQANTETIGLVKQAEARMKQLKMMDKDGNLLPTDAKTAENFRQFLNTQWDRKNSYIHKQLKEAVDEDVLANLDRSSPLYADARKLVEIRKNTLENPNGISRILNAEGPGGINRKVDIEKIADSITGLGVDQFSHIIDTLRSVPKNLQPAAEKAIGEIKAHFLKKANESFTSSANKGTKYLNDNREVMNKIFSKEELDKIRDYNNAHHILKTDTGYPGAGAQSLNIEQKLGVGRKITEQLAKKGAMAGTSLVTGGATLGAAETLAHELVGRKFEKSAAKKLEKSKKEQLAKEQQNFKPINQYFK